MPEHELPASVRVALWGTAALTGAVPAQRAALEALPDFDHVEGLVQALELWRSLGERVVLVALPRPGDLTGMPQGGPDLLAAALGAEECAFVPGLGGAVVPMIAEYGPHGDQGWGASWELFDADPVPVHQVEAVDLGQTELHLRQQLYALTETIAAAGPAPFGEAADRALARARAATDGARRWGVPKDVPPRAMRVIDLAATVLVLAETGLHAAPHSLDATTADRRASTLRLLAGSARHALADAANAGALHLAYRR